MESFKLLKRRDGFKFTYSLSFLDTKTVVMLETAPHETPRRICYADISHADELQDKCDAWNAENDAAYQDWLLENM